VQHAAIDLGAKESQICIRGVDGKIIEEGKLQTKKLADVMKTWPKSRVVLETCAEAFRLADAAKLAGHEVRVVPGTLVRLLGVGARGVKNDQRDAQHLSEASWRADIPSVHIPSQQARELRSICGARDVLVGSRTKVINNVRGWLRTRIWRIRSGSPASFADRVRGVAASLNETLPEHVERQLRTVEALHEEVRGADRQLAAWSRKSEVCRRLMSIPGIGVITAVRFIAAIDDPTRFASAHRVQSYLGLTPGEHSSSERERKTGISKAGPTALRLCLVQGAWMVFRMKQPMSTWAHQLAERRGRHVAIVALARKLAGIMFAVWRDGSVYSPR